MFVLNDLTQCKQLDEKVSRKVLGCGGSLLMAEVSFKKDGIGQIHSHEEYEQVSYIVKGSFKVTVGEEAKVLKAGDSFYADKNTPHGVIALEDSIILDIFTPLRKDFIEV
ncbi:cupin domain-containing protein [Clostridium swellfunianum]|uniref:cupin domain-containing protein n=1 Tax=Clostridium swellfunianum TaxID=1367462 RepID=UPI00202E5A31|nr:cupin domain-containing protein [Clostridium swellfunianum]MCM0649583.1 cupin domain-containing protein [Clostridium swellfunianum]